MYIHTFIYYICVCKLFKYITIYVNVCVCVNVCTCVCVHVCVGVCVSVCGVYEYAVA